MHGHNAAFVADPLGYLNATVVDNVTYFRTNPPPAAVGLANAAKHANFDLNFASMLPERRAVLRITPGGLIGDVAIAAYWCPFLSGGGLPGWVDLPLQNPPRRLMLTAAMQGCALVVTQSPAGAHSIRVYHHQHPEGNTAAAISAWNALNNVGQAVTSMLAYGDYGAGGLGAAQASNAFNFLYYRNANWNFVTQGHILVPGAMGFSVRRRAGHGNNGVSMTSVG